MKSTSTLAADGAAERIVRHFRAKGFAGISEALIIRIRLRKGDRTEVDAAFEAAADQEEMPPVHQYFETRPFGYFSDFRSFAEARSAIQSDFTVGLRNEVPRVFFDPAPVVIEDALASGTKYDVMMKLRDNVDGYAFAILLNDPDSSFLDYLESHRGNDWRKIMGEFETTVMSLDAEIDLL
ncbi:MAG: hypothetical protein ACOY9D_01765 [Pseudomonadota bacterium]